jgi:hypothetical protein
VIEGIIYRYRCGVPWRDLPRWENARMGAIDDFWSAGAGELRSNFERARIAHIDSAIKGGLNEQILATFLRQNLGVQRIALKSAIIDAEDHRSDEVDVSVVNENQPLWTGDLHQLLIAEGIDAVYQVKARLSTDELRRAIANAKSVKKLFRPLGSGSVARASDSDGPRFIDRIPFFIFGYTSNISAESALKLLGDELADIPWDQQPDGIFLLDGWSIINVGDNAGSLKVGPPEARGLNVVDGQYSSLATMLWCHTMFVHRAIHTQHPLVRYQPFRKLGPL